MTGTLFRPVVVIALAFFCFSLATPLIAAEVDKGKIPADQLAKSYKKLAWDVAIWDTDEAATNLKSGEKYYSG